MYEDDPRIEEDGEWVKWEDVQALIDENRVLKDDILFWAEEHVDSVYSLFEESVSSFNYVKKKHLEADSND